MTTKKKLRAKRYIASGGGGPKKVRATIEPATRLFQFFCGRCKSTKGFRLCYGDDSYIGDGTGPVNALYCEKCGRIHKTRKGLTDLLNEAFQSGKDARSSEIRKLLDASPQLMSDA